MSAKDDMKDYLAKHPRMIGVLFTLLLLLTQAGTVAAGTNTHVGP
ncbi:DUF7503 family protein [Natrialbaceae archaeon A-gly3]